MKISSLVRIIGDDYSHYLDGTAHKKPAGNSIKALVVSLLDCDFMVVLRYRIARFLLLNNFRMLARLMALGTKRRYACDIDPDADIGAGLRINHAFNIVVSGGATLGRNVALFNGVSIGNKYPQMNSVDIINIADNCIIGTGAKLLGNIDIGSSIMIGANQVITCSISSKGDISAMRSKGVRVREVSR